VLSPTGANQYSHQLAWAQSIDVCRFHNSFTCNNRTRETMHSTILLVKAVKIKF
jgi:hypothetical protein